MLEYCAKELLLEIRSSDIGDDDDHSGMQHFLSMKIKEIRTIVRYECVVILKDSGHEFPILQAT